MSKVQKINVRSITVSLMCFCFIIGIFILQFGQLQWSFIAHLAAPSEILNRSLILNAANITAICLFNLLVLFITTNWFHTVLISNIVVTIWSFANYYVWLYHGSPLFLSEFLSAGTAIGVLNGYTFHLSGPEKYLFAFTFMEIIFALILQVLELDRKRIRRKVCFFCGGGVSILLFFLLFSNMAVKPQNTGGFSWGEPIQKYGFLACFMEDCDNLLHPYRMPEGYDAEKIVITENDNNEANESLFPDIILILNETFCDLQYYADISIDSDYMAPFYNIENAEYGYVPAAGGTNNSEYELLTSNSLDLLKSPAPFNYADMSKMNTVVSYLKYFGYETWAMHCGWKGSYSRNRAYPAMCFDHIMFEENFSVGAYGKRPWLDKDNYEDLIREYENGSESPRFMYLLTYQNHGGYNQNDSEFDKVHLLDDCYGELAQEIDEFLTSASMSAQAIPELIKFFSEVSRPVIICMVGDHPPYFINQLKPKSYSTEDEKALAQQMVPYMIWANYDMKEKNSDGYASLISLVPMILEKADLPLTHYYRTILELRKEIPALGRGDLCMDESGNVVRYSENRFLYDKILNYQYLEYNGLKKGMQYREKLFVP